MIYASFVLLVVIHHLILNTAMIKNKNPVDKSASYYHYRCFLFSILSFYITDLLWGFLYETNLRWLAYIDTVLFFGTMALSLLFWTRFVISFVGTNDLPTKIFYISGTSIFIFVILLLIINFFTPIIFTFTENMEYVTGSMRYILFIMQIILFASSTIYCFIISRTTIGKRSSIFIIIGMASAVMAMFIVIQFFMPYAPLYSIGCMLANCLVHVYVEEDEKREINSIATEATNEKNIYGQIANSLAAEYEAIYYIDIETGEYREISTNAYYNSMDVTMEGRDFYAETRANARKYTHPDDVEFAESLYTKEAMLEKLAGKKSYSYQYRIIFDNQVRFFQFAVVLSDDNKHFILTDRDITDTITSETERARALSKEKEIARRDELTGVKNKLAFSELEQELQHELEETSNRQPFALVVCDLNDLKKINDTKGHQAGDTYIKDSAKLMCDIFVHSPVYRIGGDEFAIFLSGDDYSLRHQLVDKIHSSALKNIENHNGPIIAIGMSEYVQGRDKNIKDIFDRADYLMYENKKELKARG